jgi:hypothetical protein
MSDAPVSEAEPPSLIDAMDHYIAELQEKLDAINKANRVRPRVARVAG